jgi:hypothetical protein
MLSELNQWLKTKRQGSERQKEMSQTVWDNGYWCGRRDSYDLVIARIDAIIKSKEGEQ